MENKEFKMLCFMGIIINLFLSILFIFLINSLMGNFYLSFCFVFITLYINLGDILKKEQEE